MGYTGYYIVSNQVYGPEGFTENYMDDNNIYSKEGFRGYYVQDNYIYGPRGFTSYYLDQEGFIYGPSNRIPWLDKKDEPVVSELVDEEKK